MFEWLTGRPLNDRKYTTCQAACRDVFGRSDVRDSTDVNRDVVSLQSDPYVLIEWLVRQILIIGT